MGHQQGVPFGQPPALVPLASPGLWGIAFLPGGLGHVSQECCYPVTPLSLVTFMRCLVRSVWSLRKAWACWLPVSRAPFWGWEMVVLDTGVSACFHKVLLPALAPLVLPMKGDAPLSPLYRDQSGWGG